MVVLCLAAITVASAQAAPAPTLAGLHIAKCTGYRSPAAANPVNYVELDGHMVVLDETGGKPPVGYGSGPTGGSPIATATQTAATLGAEAAAIQADTRRTCFGGGSAFGGGFCQAAQHEVQALRLQSTILAQQPSFAKVPQQLQGVAQRLRDPIEGSNAVLVIFSGACVAGSLIFTAGTSGPVCASIYFGATATSVAATAYGVNDLKKKRSNSVETIGTFNAFFNVACPLFGGAKTTACRIITGTTEGIITPSLATGGLRDSNRPDWHRFK
jgi:hypothetical protein